MSYYVGNMPVGEHLEHHGIRGMRWGQRRYQNRDGSLTSAGRVRYAVGTGRTNMRRSRGNQALARAARSNASRYWNSSKKRKNTARTAAKVVGAAAATAGAVYLGKRYGKGAVRAVGRLAKRGGNIANRVRSFNIPNRARLTSGASASRLRKGINYARATAKGTASRVGTAAGKAGASFKNSARNLGAKARSYSQQPWYTRGVEKSVKRSAERSTRAAVRKKVNAQVNEAFGKVRKSRPDFAERAFDSASAASARRAAKARKARISKEVNEAFRSMSGGRKVNTKNVKRAVRRAADNIKRGAGSSTTAKNAKQAARRAADNIKRSAGNVKETGKYYVSKASNSAKNATSRFAKRTGAGTGGRVAGQTSNIRGSKTFKRAKNVERARNIVREAPGKAKAKAKSAAKKYNNYMNSSSRVFSPLTKREALRSYGKGFAIGSAPGVALIGAAKASQAVNRRKRNKKKKAAASRR